MTVTVDVFAALPYIGLGLIVVLGLMAVFFAGAKLRSFLASFRFERQDRESLRQRWAEIEKLLDQPGEVSRKLAIIEADKLLDSALKSLSMPGATLGERLKFAAYKYPDIRNVWWAHKIRNQLAHEASYHLDAGMARNALREYRRTLERLGAI
ncbi:MAG: hypothetical protein PHT12_06480 [Patescibacteria group bacterium]|nr:hypothetical protein [Patescibacteria group bacterium]